MTLVLNLLLVNLVSGIEVGEGLEGW